MHRRPRMVDKLVLISEFLHVGSPQILSANKQIISLLFICIHMFSSVRICIEQIFMFCTNFLQGRVTKILVWYLVAEPLFGLQYIKFKSKNDKEFFTLLFINYFHFYPIDFFIICLKVTRIYTNDSRPSCSIKFFKKVL